MIGTPSPLIFQSPISPVQEERSVDKPLARNLLPEHATRGLARGTRHHGGTSRCGTHIFKHRRHFVRQPVMGQSGQRFFIPLAAVRFILGTRIGAIGNQWRALVERLGFGAEHPDRRGDRQGDTDDARDQRHKHRLTNSLRRRHDTIQQYVVVRRSNSATVNRQALLLVDRQLSRSIGGNTGGSLDEHHGIKRRRADSWGGYGEDAALDQYRQKCRHRVDDKRGVAKHHLVSVKRLEQ